MQMVRENIFYKGDSSASFFDNKKNELKVIKVFGDQIKEFKEKLGWLPCSLNQDELNIGNWSYCPTPIEYNFNQLITRLPDIATNNDTAYAAFPHDNEENNFVIIKCNKKLIFLDKTEVIAHGNCNIIHKTTFDEQFFSLLYGIYQINFPKKSIV